jgi:hypothetical protein
MSNGSEAISRDCKISLWCTLSVLSFHERVIGQRANDWKKLHKSSFITQYCFWLITNHECNTNCVFDDTGQHTKCVRNHNS